ncbi:MAG: hypothetical protein ACUVX1_00730 [Chloroflexota bacterium]
MARYPLIQMQLSLRDSTVGTINTPISLADIGLKPLREGMFEAATAVAPD